ncbi:MAG: hypothetical protein ACK58L_00870 [Planctomycetota bacterium]
MATTTEKARRSNPAFHNLTVAKKATAAIRKAVAKGDAAALQSAWMEALGRSMKHLRKALGDSPLLALWSLESAELSSRERELAVSINNLYATDKARKHGEKPSKQAKNKKRSIGLLFDEILTNWLADETSAMGTWESLALAEILLRHGSGLSPEGFARVLNRLAGAHGEETLGGLFDAAELADPMTDPIQILMNSGEMPWLCGLVLAPVADVSERLDSGRSFLEKSLLDSTDADGLFHASLLRRLPEWLAPMARCTLWSNFFQKPLWSDEACLRLASVTERAAMLIQPQQLHHAESDTPTSAAVTLTEVLDILLPVSGSPFDHKLLKLLRKSQRPAPQEVRRPARLRKSRAEDSEESSGEGKQKRPKKIKDNKPQIATSSQSDTSNLAVLRSSLEPDADLATLEWHAGIPELTLSAAGVSMLTGPWTWSLMIDDQPVELPNTWKCSCWFPDAECVFVELEGEGSDSIRRVRQLMLAPHDRFAVLTESVTCGDPGRKVQLTTTLKTAADAVAEPDEITRELSLTAAQRRIRTFPIWMDDDRILNSNGSYRLLDGRLELTGVGAGGVTMPLALDWHPKRTQAPADWSRLTVTEARRVLKSHEASGHRIRIGEHQVLIYRSLQSGQNSRAVLGLHTWDESVYSRIPAVGGILQALVEVEAPE